MKLRDTNIWLFSFADLAFLLLIAFTQASTIGKAPVSIGEMNIPKVVDSPDIASIDQYTRFSEISAREFLGFTKYFGRSFSSARSKNSNSLESRLIL